MKRIFAVVFLMMALCGLAVGQTTTTTTTLSAAISTTSANWINVTSATGFTAGTTACFVDKEAMLVQEVSSTRIRVIRGMLGTPAVTHASGALVYVGPRTGPFITADKSGTCTAANELYLPQINPSLGKIYNCISSTWVVSAAGSDAVRIYPYQVASTIVTAGAGTYTAAQLLGGIILRDPTGAARTDTMSTAALLVAAMPGVQIGSSFVFTVRNTADAAETITVAAGTGGTTSGTMTIAQTYGKSFLVVITAVAGTPTYTVYSLGTVVW
jgi:hypothetical protein